MTKPKVLLVYQSYLPSEYAMGPVSAIKSLIGAMGGEFEIRLITLNHDFLTGEPLFPEGHHIVAGEMATTEYVPRGFEGLKLLFDRLREHHDIVEIHSGFDRNLAIPAIALARLGLVNATQIFHSPHGIFLPIDMSRGAFKKRLYCRIADLTGLYKSLVHLASSPGEASDIKRWHQTSQRILQIPHFVDLVLETRENPPRQKAAKSLKIAFVGRVALQKNLLFAIEVVRRLQIPAQLDVFGDADPEYLPGCESELAKGTGLCTVKLHGQIPQKDLLELLPGYDVLLHPTLGENFGYSIIEALNVGVPVVLSDQSPWLDVAEFNAGWVLPLSDPGEFVRRLEQIYDMGSEWQSLSSGAMRYAREKIDNVRSTELRRSLYAGDLSTS